MRRGDDIVRALRAGLVRRRLHAGVEGLARVVLTEAVDEFPGLVLEVGGRGRGDGLGRADAEDGDLIAAGLERHIGGEDALIRLQRHEVGRYVGEAGAFGQFEEARHAVIELMVARHGRVVAHFVHDARDILALGERAERRALNGVAHVDEQHVLARFFQRRLDAGHARVAKALADAAVYVGGKEEHDLGIGKGRVLRARERLRGGGEQQKRRRQAKEQYAFAVFVHCVFPPFPLAAGSGRISSFKSQAAHARRMRERPKTIPCGRGRPCRSKAVCSRGCRL